MYKNNTPNLLFSVLIGILLLFHLAETKSQPLLTTQTKYPHPEKNPNSSLMLYGDWVPDDTHTIDFDHLPKIKRQHVIVSDVKDSNGVNQHNYLVFYDNKFWLMWSDGPGIEDRVGQRVSFATSSDGLNWSKPKFLSP